jgi:ankyrin repeat protein
MEKKSDIFTTIQLGRIALYEKLITDHDINTRNKYGENLLHTAIAYGQKEIALDLISRSIDTNAQDKKGQTPLHILFAQPNIELTKKILGEIIEKVVEINTTDSYGNTSLWCAVFNARGKYDSVVLLLSKGANPNIKNKAGRSPLDFAIQIKDEKLISILQKVPIE